MACKHHNLFLNAEHEPQNIVHEELAETIVKVKKLAEKLHKESINGIEQTAENAHQEILNSVTIINDRIDSTTSVLNSSVNAAENRINVRVDNIIAHNNDTEGNTELIDIRTGVNGTTYETAGDAVRGQIENLTLNYRHNEVVPPLYYGSLNTATGLIVKTDSVNNRLVSDITERKNLGKIILCGSNIYVIAAYYQSASSSDFDHSSDWLRGDQNNGVYELEDYPYVSFLIKKSDNGTLTTSENGYFYLRQNDIIDQQIEGIHTELSQAQNDMQDMDTFLSNKIADTVLTLSPFETEERNCIENDDCSTGNTLTVDKRWFMPHAFCHGDVISNISFYSTTNSTVTIEIWERDNNTLIRVQTNSVITDQPGIYSAALNYAVKKSAYISVIQTRSTIPFQSDSNSYLMYSSDISSQTSSLSYSSLTNLMSYIPSINISYKANCSTTLLIGKGMRYENIQDALDNITDDSAQKPYTLLILPSENPYPRFSMIRKLDQSYPWSNVSPRYISIIGLNKKDCVIQADSGEYDSPPAEIMTNGIIKNLTFRMTKNDPRPTPVKGGYAVHIDCRTLNDTGYKMTFENCDFYSETAPAVGIGGHTNTDLTFSGCTFESTSSSEYQPNENYVNLTVYGCVFAHTSVLADAVNQKLTFRNCVGICKEGNKSLWAAKAGDFSSQTGDFQLTLLNNIFWNESTGTSAYVIDPNIDQNPINFGNNI